MAVTMEGEVKAIQVRACLEQTYRPITSFHRHADIPKGSLTSVRLTHVAIHTPRQNAMQKDAEAKMKKSVDAAENNMKAIRTGRASYVGVV